MTEPKTWAEKELDEARGQRNTAYAKAEEYLAVIQLLEQERDEARNEAVMVRRRLRAVPHESWGRFPWEKQP